MWNKIYEYIEQLFSGCSESVKNVSENFYQSDGKRNVLRPCTCSCVNLSTGEHSNFTIELDISNISNLREEFCSKIPKNYEPEGNIIVNL